MRTLVAGIGSPILTDDGVGVHAVRLLEERGVPEGADTVEIGTAGLTLVDLVRGYDRLVVIDAIVTGALPGTVHVLTGADVARGAHLGPGHEADLPTVLELGREIAGEKMPGEVVVVAVEAGDLTTFSEELTPEVAAALPEVLREVARRCGEPE